MGFATFCVYEFKSNLPPKIVTRKKKKNLRLFLYLEYVEPMI